MLFSIIIPVYNAEKYLAECIHSCINQGIPKDEYEIICVNDGSTDGSGAILRGFLGKANITVLDRSNGGPSRARNFGLQQAQGQYIWMVDADDVISPFSLSLMKEFLGKKTCDILTLGCYTFQQTLSAEEKRKYDQGTLPVNTPADNGCVWSKVFLRSFLNEGNLRFHEDLVLSEDIVFLEECAQHRPLEATLDTTVYLYRKSGGSLTASTAAANIEKKAQSHSRAAEILWNYYKNENNEPERLANVVMYNLWSALYEIASLPKAQSAQRIDQLGVMGMFPFERLKECTLSESTIVKKSSVAGKIFNFIYLHQHKRWGYRAMRILLHSHVGARFMRLCWGK